MTGQSIGVFILMAVVIVSATGLAVVKAIPTEMVGAIFSNVLTGVFAWLARSPSSSQPSLTEKKNGN